MNEENKKSYNPFKMWGAWVGGILFYLGWFNFYLDSSASMGFIKNILLPFTIISSVESSGIDKLLIVFLVIIVLGIGFFLGWAIHSLIRKIKK